MEPVTTLITALAAKLASNAVAKIADELPKRVRTVVGGDPTALQKCFAAGFEAALKEMRPPDSERLHRYEGILMRWLDLPDVAEELAKLVDVGAVTDDPTRALDLARLNTRLKEAYPIEENPDAYAGLNFPAALRAFARAYTAEVEKQADKFPWLQFRLLKEMVSRFDARPRGNTLREMYLGWLADECDLLPLSVFSAKQAAPGVPTKTTLREVYVPLDVILLPPARHVELSRLEKIASFFGREVSREKPRDLPAELENVEREQRVPALRALAQSHRVVLLGDPGSGKTTLVNHLALCLAMHELQPDADWLARLDEWTPGQLLPVRVVLREFAARAIPANGAPGNAGMVWRFIESEMEAHGYKEFYAPLRAELLDHGGLLLLDGLDEVPEADGRRVRVQEAIGDFARTATKCRIVVTCRTYAYARSVLEGFDASPITPFSPEQIAVFIVRWYEAVREKEHFTQAEAADRAATLKAAVDDKRDSPLADLASRPLLLTLMAMLHASEGKLPEDRSDLYEKCVELLLDYWQQRKQVRDENGTLRIEGGLLETIGISKATLRSALYRIAFDAHERQGKSGRGARTADIQPAELEAVLKPAVGSDEKHKIALCYIRDRAGLIYWRDPTYTFPHRSFQEYLAACHLSNLDKYLDVTRELVRHDLEWWREVYLLEVGRQRGNLGTAIALVNHLCSDPRALVPNPQPIHWQTAVLAAQALLELHLPAQIAAKRQQGEDIELSESILNRVVGWLVALTETPVLTPRERAQAGLVLGALGDPRNFYELCRVPAGEFTLGEGEKAHTISVPEFWIGKYPVTCAQYRAFIDAGGYEKPDYWRSKSAKEWLAQSKQTAPKYWDDPRLNQPNLPVVGVTWFEANAYCAWLTEQLRTANSELRTKNPAAISAIHNSQFEIRLPTEAEWEKAASWDANNKVKRVYPWGDEFDPAKANTAEGENSVGSTTTIGIYPNGESPCGARDMSGNVWEWCSTIYREYPYRLDAAHESLESNERRVLRGGSWYDYDGIARCASRNDFDPANRDHNIGFRVAESFPT